RPARVRRGRGRWMPWIGLLVGLLTTALFALMAANTARVSDAARFEHAVDVARERLLNRMRNYGALLLGTERLFSVEQGRMTEETFTNFVHGLGLQRSYPGILGLGFAARLDPQDPHPVAEEIFRNARASLPDPLPTPGD